MPRVDRKVLTQTEFSDNPTRIDVLSQIQRIFTSSDFQATDRLRRFLSFIVQETIDGKEDKIKSYTIAVEVLGRDSNFDLQNDPVVRIEAGRLRRALERYYLIAGRTDPVLIQIPKGAYVPRFSWTQASPESFASPQLPVVVSPGREPQPLRWGAAVLALSIGSAGLAFALWAASPRHSAAPAAMSQDRPVLIVSPFFNLSGDIQTRELAAGVTEEVISQLAASREFTLFQREATSAKPPATPDSQEFGSPDRKFILEGSVRTSRGVLRVNGRVLDLTSGKVLWSQSYDCDLRGSDRLSAEAAIGVKIASAVSRPGSSLLPAGLIAPVVPVAAVEERRLSCL
jgi:adenylate cyclase